MREPSTRCRAGRSVFIPATEGMAHVGRTPTTEENTAPQHCWRPRERLLWAQRVVVTQRGSEEEGPPCGHTGEAVLESEVGSRKALGKFLEAGLGSASSAHRPQGGFSGARAEHRSPQAMSHICQAAAQGHLEAQQCPSVSSDISSSRGRVPTVYKPSGNTKHPTGKT